MTTTSPLSRPSDPPVLRLSGPGDMTEAIPHLLGFVPAQSLVVVGLKPPRRRIGATMRVDLAGPDDDRTLAEQVAGFLAGKGMTGALIAVYDDEDVAEPPGGGGLVRRRLTLEVTRALKAVGMEVQDAVLVRGGRWWSYRCFDDACCPREGTPLVDASSPGVVTAVFAVEHGMPLASREAVVASLASDVPLGMGEQVQQARQQLLGLSVAERRSRLAREHATALAAVRDGTGPSREQVAALLALTCQVQCRDDAMLGPRHPEILSAVRLWSLLLRQAPPSNVADTAAVLAVAAHAAGESVLARTAVERGLAARPGHVMCGLMQQVLDLGIPPDWVVLPSRRERRNGARGRR